PRCSRRLRGGGGRLGGRDARRTADHGAPRDALRSCPHQRLKARRRARRRTAAITVHRARRRAHAASSRERGPAEFARISDAPLSPTPAKRRVMENTTTKGTARRVLLAATAIAAFALSACTTPPAPTDPSTRWLPAGCVD